MQNRVHASRTPTILYVGFMPGHGIDLMRLAGLRRYAATRGWNVETLDDKDCSPKTLRDTLARLRPIGCVSNYCDPIIAPGWEKSRTVLAEPLEATLAFPPSPGPIRVFRLSTRTGERQGELAVSPDGGFTIPKSARTIYFELVRGHECAL